MDFKGLVAAAAQRASDQGETDAAAARERLQIAQRRFGELASLLRDQADAIRALPAELVVAERRAEVNVKAPRGLLRLTVVFEPDVWNCFVISWTDVAISSADDGHRKASTAAEAVAVLAELIGRHRAGLDLHVTSLA